MKWFLRILGAVLILLIVLIAGLVGYVYYDLNFGPDSTELTNTIIEANDTTLHAYLAEPEGEGPFPGVIMIHEWWGLRPDMIEKADNLAEKGYVVLAVDAYRGQATDAVPTALFMALSYPQETIDADMDVFVDYLAGLDNVNADQLAVMGFCFGGRQSVRFGVRQAQQFDAILTYYGGGQMSTAEELAPLREAGVSVLGVFGSDDPSIPPETVATFEESLQLLNLEYDVTVYQGVGHAFVKDLESPGPSRDAWLEGIAFLDNHVKTAG